MSKAVARFERAARDRGLSLEILRFPEGTKTAPDAAHAVGCEVGQIVKSLVFMADGVPLIALTSGANRVDPMRLAAVAGVSEVRRASPEEARAATGFAVGGVPPFGHELPVVLDQELLEHDRVWAAAGDPHSLFEVDPRELAERTDARVAEVGK